MGDRRHPAPPIAPAQTNSRHLLQPEASSYRFGQLNSSCAGAPNYLYCAPQSSYSSNRMRDGALDDAGASAASATCHVMSPSNASNSYATNTTANTSNSALASASSHKTLTAMVYYQQQPQQHQTQQQQQQYQQQQTTQLPVQLQLQHPLLQTGGDGKQSVYAPPTVQAGFPLIFFDLAYPTRMAQRAMAGIARETLNCIPQSRTSVPHNCIRVAWDFSSLKEYLKLCYDHFKCLYTNAFSWQMFIWTIYLIVYVYISLNIIFKC